MLTLGHVETTTEGWVILILFASPFSAKLQAAVVLNPGYSSIPPVFRLCLNWKGEKTNSNDDNIRVRPTWVAGGQGTLERWAVCQSQDRDVPGSTEHARRLISHSVSRLALLTSEVSVHQPLQHLGWRHSEEQTDTQTAGSGGLTAGETLGHPQAQHVCCVRFNREAGLWYRDRSRRWV